MADRRRLLALLGLAMLGSTAAADDEPAPKDWPITKERAHKEAKLLRAAGPSVRRDGQRLSLRSRSGKTADFDSIHPGSDREADYVDFRYAGSVLGGRFHVVTVLYYEGDSYFLISSNSGTATEIYAQPRPSPDGRYIFVASPSDAYNVNGIFLWEVPARGDLIERLSLVPTEYERYHFAHWNKDQTVTLKRISSYEGHCTPDQLWHQAMTLQRDGEHWKLRPHGAGLCKDA